MTNRKNLGNILPVMLLGMIIHLSVEASVFNSAKPFNVTNVFESATIGRVAPVGFIRNTLSGKCVDVPGAPGTTNGTKLQLWDCETKDSKTDQRWDRKWKTGVVNKFFMVNRLSGRCLDVAGRPGTANGTAVTISDCEWNDTNTDQEWTITTDGFIKNARSGKCLDVAGKPGEENGLALEIFDCETNVFDTDQKWRYF